MADADVVQEMMTTKNALIDKTGVLEGLWSNLLGKSFLFSKTDDVWKKKRKGLGHAFYKDKLVVLLQTLQRYVHAAQKDWLDFIAMSDNKSVKMDMSKEFMQIMMKFLTHVLFGWNVEKIKVTILSNQNTTGKYQAK